MPELSLDIQRAADLLRQGGLVAFPTETVYGLGADAANPAAVRKLFAAKGRPADHPLIVHLEDAAQLEPWSLTPPEVAHHLAEAFWPGPLTLIVRRSKLASDLVTGGQDTVGLRVPAHPLAQALLAAFGGALVAPSANRFGRISPTRAEHVAEELGNRVDMILDGGPCRVGLESTILDLSRGAAKVLRPGGISVKALTDILGYTPETGIKSEVRASGTLESHYAPTTPAFLLESDEVDKLMENVPKCASVLSFRQAPEAYSGLWLTLPSDPQAYGQRLYAALRELDGLGLDRILIEAVPDTDAWLAVRDRLRRATFQSKVQVEEARAL